MKSEESGWPGRVATERGGKRMDNELLVVVILMQSKVAGAVTLVQNKSIDSVLKNIAGRDVGSEKTVAEQVD